MTKIKLKNKKVAIIGGGVSGICAAHFLAENYNISLYEKETSLGGHAITLKKKLAINNTVTRNIFFDIGFLVYNDRNYPNFSKLIDDILVKTEKSNMSFSVSNSYSGFEYGSTGLLALTNNLKNLFFSDFYNMLLNISRYYKVSKEFLKKENENISLGEFLKIYKFNKNLINIHIIPMCAAIWSTSSEKVLNMPAKYILKFLDNHGLLSFFNRPQWKTISNGSKNYINKLEKITKAIFFKKEQVIKVERKNNRVHIHSRNFSKSYDYVIFAVHADDILKLLDKPSSEEKEIFSRYNYEENDIYVHYDKKLMPYNKNVWSSWNVIISNNKEDYSNKICVTYWINKLQNFNSKYPILVTLNPPAEFKINKNKILKKIKLKHPLLEKNHLSLSEKVEKIQGNNMTYYTGAWLGYGFHEDGINSSKNIYKLISNS